VSGKPKHDPPAGAKLCGDLNQTFLHMHFDEAADETEETRGGLSHSGFLAANKYLTLKM
jgi:hypothetical protein